MSDATQTQTRQLQQKLLEMMHFFHQFCADHQLTYIAQGGTMLGAVRHNGFIPWDDDLDVGMPRKDYEKLARLLPAADGDSLAGSRLPDAGPADANSRSGEKAGSRLTDVGSAGADSRSGEKAGSSSGTSEEQQLLPQELPRYVLETPHSTAPDYWFPFSKLYDTTTTFVEESRNHFRRGVYLDIFPLDGLGHTYEEAKENYREIYWLNRKLVLRRLEITPRRAWYKNVVMGVVQALPFRDFQEKYLCEQLDAVCASRSLDAYEYGGNLLGHWGFREVMPVSVFGTPRLYPFEDMQIYGAADYDAYLTHLYGNWRKLPPKEKRTAHHHDMLDLQKGYR